MNRSDFSLRRGEVRVFCILLVIYAFFVSLGPGRTPGARVMAHAYALLHEHRNTIDTCHWNTVDKAYFGGHYFASAGPGMGWLAVGPLIVFEGIYSLIPSAVPKILDQPMRLSLLGREKYMIQDGYLSFDPAINQVDLVKFHASIWFFELVIAFIMAAGVVVYYRILRLFDVEDGLASEASLVLGLGTIMFYYSRMGFAVVPCAFLLLAAFYQLVLVSRRPNTPAGTNAARLVISGLALGVAVAMEYIQIIGAALVFLYGWRRLGSRQACWIALGGIPVGLLIMMYHYAAFGNPFAFPHQYLIPLFTDHSVGLLGLTYPTPGRVAALTLGVKRGLFVYSPVLLVPLVLLVRGTFVSRRHVAEGLLALSLFGGYILFQATSPLVGQTWGIGPRYAAAMTPFLMLGVIYLRSPFERRAFEVLALFSIFISWLTVQRDIEAKHFDNPLLASTKAFLHFGPSSSVLEQALALTKASPLASLSVSVAAYAVLAGIVWFIWRKTACHPPLATVA